MPRGSYKTQAPHLLSNWINAARLQSEKRHHPYLRPVTLYNKMRVSIIRCQRTSWIKLSKHVHTLQIYTRISSVLLVGREIGPNCTLRMLNHIKSCQMCMPNVILRPTIMRAVLRTKPPQSYTISDLKPPFLVLSYT